MFGSLFTKCSGVAECEHIIFDGLDFTPVLGKAPRAMGLWGAGQMEHLAPLWAFAPPELEHMPHLVVVESYEAAQKILGTLRALRPQMWAGFLSAPERSAYGSSVYGPTVYSQTRASALTRAQNIRWLYMALQNRGGVFLCTKESLSQQHMPRALLKAQNFRLNESLPQDLPKFFESLGYTATPLVEDPGTYAIRGGVVDVFSPLALQPFRLELAGHKITAIRQFDCITQNSLGPAKSLSLLPMLEAPPSTPLQDFFATEPLCWSRDTHPCTQHMPHSSTVELLGCFKPAETSSSRDLLHFDCQALNSSILSGHSLKTTEKNFRHKLNLWQKHGLGVFIFAPLKSHQERLAHILNPLNIPFRLLNADSSLQEIPRAQLQGEAVHIIPRALPESLYVKSAGLVLLNASTALPAHTVAPIKVAGKKILAHSLSFADAAPGELVVHRQHGIGVFEGLKVLKVHGIEAEYIVLRYKNDDRLYVPIYTLSLVQKYTLSQNHNMVDTLGGAAWMRAQVRIKSKLRDIAAELLKLYAQRSQIKRPPLVLDKAAYKDFCAKFPHEPTLDQVQAIQDIQKDFASPNPSDRLICGDVGFGKTEVAMRACFQAVKNKKQIALIAPTTILSFQHLESFKARFPKLTVHALNRFVPKKDQKQILQKLARGDVHIIIGTHRLLGSDIKFNNLGLLIIDEEQKFGVRHKEKIKHLKLGVDTLSLSATPIPRTLNFSLIGLRDFSLISTPPKNRLPIQSFVSRFNTDSIRRATMSEIARQGQVFFLHSRVADIEALAETLREALPQSVRIGVAHGQMPERMLERSMLDFWQKKTDLLICTTIIESGLDIPNANTMFINNAHAFGLGQLYQLRGRIGRSHHRGYCFLLTDTKKLSPAASARLKVICDNNALGSGIKVAQYDLELRGSGNILGEDQHGHTQTLGYELYTELLQEAIAEHKNKKLDKLIEPDIQLPIPALLPHKYMPDIRLRLQYYKKLSTTHGEEEFEAIEHELQDRFGPLPQEVLNFLGVMRIRQLCQKLKITKLMASTAQRQAGATWLSLDVDPGTTLDTSKVVHLVKTQTQYRISAKGWLQIKLPHLTWPIVYEAVQDLEKKL